MSKLETALANATFFKDSIEINANLDRIYGAIVCETAGECREILKAAKAWQTIIEIFRDENGPDNDELLKAVETAWNEYYRVEPTPEPKESG